MSDSDKSSAAAVFVTFIGRSYPDGRPERSEGKRSDGGAIGSDDHRERNITSLISRLLRSRCRRHRRRDYAGHTR